jgi:PTS system galactitol-specific IIA component
MSFAENAPQSQFALNENLILVKQLVNDKTELLSTMADLLYMHGHVKSSYKEALLSREEVFPTGLTTQVSGVAIPHADTSHVNRSAIAMATLQQPVNFQAMDNPNNTVQVEIVIMLAIKEPKSQLKMLQNIVHIIQQNDILTSIIAANSASEVMEILNEHL